MGLGVWYLGSQIGDFMNIWWGAKGDLSKLTFGLRGASLWDTSTRPKSIKHMGGT